MKYEDSLDQITEEDSVKSDEDMSADIPNTCQDVSTHSDEPTEDTNTWLITRMINIIGEHNLYKSDFRTKVTGQRYAHKRSR